MTSPSRLYRRDNRGLNRAVVELVQRGHLIMDVSSAYLKASEATFGAFHPATWQFRNSLTAACRLRERLRAELGTDVLEAALCELPVTTLTLRDEAEGSPARQTHRNPRQDLLRRAGRGHRAFADSVATDSLMPTP